MDNQESGQSDTAPISQQLHQPLWTAANFVSALRIPLGLLFLPLAGQVVWELTLLALAAVTDFLDGQLARRMGQAGGLGAIIDPICDKFFLLMVVLSYALNQRLPLWMLLLVIGRDLYILVLSAALRLSGKWRRLQVNARPAGKIATVLQLLFFGLTSLLPAQHQLIWLLFALVLLSSLLACIDYSAEVRRQLKQA